MNNNKKSPLTDKPLRNPGQSLDEQINDIYQNDVTVYVMWSAVSIVLAGLEWWRWYNQLPYSPIVYSVLAFLVTIFCGYKLFHIKRKLKSLILGRDGERAVGQYLELLREKGCRIFHDIVGNSFNLDHVIVSEHGVFVIETKTYSKPTKGEAKITINGDNVFINGMNISDNILIQAKAEANWLTGIIKESTGKNILVKPAIVFPGWYVESSSVNKNTGVWFLNPKALPAYIENSPKILSKEDMMLLSFHISRYIRTT